MQELAGWPCPRNYHQWFSVQVVTRNKLFPSRVSTGTKSIFLLSAMCHWSRVASASSQMTQCCVAMGVFEGKDGIPRDLERQRPHQSHPVSSSGCHTGNSWVCESTSRGGPQKIDPGLQGTKTGLESNPSSLGRREASGEACLRPFNTGQWATSEKNRDVLPRPAVTGQRTLLLNWYR